MFETKVVEKIITLIPRSIPFTHTPHLEDRAVFELMWENIPDRPQMAKTYGAEKMLFSCRITNAADTRSLYLILTAS